MYAIQNRVSGLVFVILGFHGVNWQLSCQPQAFLDSGERGQLEELLFVTSALPHTTDSTISHRCLHQS